MKQHEEAYCTSPLHVGDRKLPVTAFRQRFDRPAGVYSWCRECEAKHCKKRRVKRSQNFCSKYEKQTATGRFAISLSGAAPEGKPHSGV